MSGWSLRRNEPTTSTRSSCLQLGDRHAEPRNAVALAVGREVAVAQAEVAPARPASTTRNSSSSVECGDASTPKLALAGAAPATSNACSQSTSCHWPSRFTIGRVQAVGRVQAFVGEAVLVRQPALVDRLVLERQHAHHAVLLHLHHQVRAERVVRRDRAAPRQLPGARLVAERLGGERAHRAEVDHVAGELGVDRALPTNETISACSPRPARPSSIMPPISWPKRTQRVHWMQRLISSAATSGPELFSEDDSLFFRVARIAAAVADREVLQLAFAALVADRAVERVVDEQELHHPVLRVLRQLGVGPDLHAVGRPAWRTPAAAWAPSRPPPGTCGSWRRSTACGGSRSAARRRRACWWRPSRCEPCGTSTSVPSTMTFRFATTPPPPCCDTCGSCRRRHGPTWARRRRADSSCARCDARTRRGSA